MAEIDYVIPALKVSQEAIFEFDELYKMLKKWFSDHNYDFFEREYLDTREEGSVSNSIKWEAERKVDEYTKFHIEVRLKCDNVKQVIKKDRKAVKGILVIKFECFLEKDYEDNWEKNFMLKFMRAVYDNFLLRGKFDKYAEDLREETYDIFNQTKSFLRLHQFGE